jgi:hypothetical protein
VPVPARLIAVGVALFAGAFALTLIVSCSDDSQPWATAPVAATPTPTPTATPTPSPVPALTRTQPPRRPALFLAPDGDDGADCTRAAPCASFSEAYRRARPGQVVELAEGEYGPQALARRPAKADRAPVWFAGAEGARVRVGDVLLGGSTTDVRGAGPLVLTGFVLGNVVTQRADGLTLSRVDVQGNVYFQGGRDIRMEHSRSGGTDDGTHSSVTAWTDDTTVEPARDVVFDDVDFHDTQMGKPGDHVECLQVTDVVGLAIRDSRFTRCDTFDVRIDAHRTDAPRSVVIERNVFGETTDRFGGTARYGLAVRAGIGVTIRHNSSISAFAGPEPTAVADGWVLKGNVLPAGRCDERIAYAANLWIDGPGCSPTDRTGPDPFVDAAGGDYRLRPGSPAVGAFEG